jgi:hypothetical protein
MIETLNVGSKWLFFDTNISAGILICFHQNNNKKLSAMSFSLSFFNIKIQVIGQDCFL